MNTKRWAIFFVFLFSSDYVVTATASLVRQKRQNGCQPKRELHDLFDKCFDDVREEMDDSYSLGNNVAGNLQFLGGQAKGLKNFKRSGPLRCVCFKEFLRVFIELSFLDITVTFVVTLLDGLLGGLLGNLGNALTRLVGQVVNLVVSLIALEINVVIAVDQRYEPGSTCRVSDYKVAKISGVKVLNIDLTATVVGLLGQVLIPVVETLLTNLLYKEVRIVIIQKIGKISISPDMYSCN